MSPLRMTTAHVTLIILVCLVSGSALACMKSATAPSTTAAAADQKSSTVPSVASPARFGSKTPGVAYVTSQGLYYDTFVVKDPLPMEGRFQLIAGGQTEFGPGQPGYLGGRWWEDTNPNGIQDPDDHYFLCPLLPPGRTTP